MDKRQIIIGIDRPMQKYLVSRGYINNLSNPPLAQAVVEVKEKEVKDNG